MAGPMYFFSGDWGTTTDAAIQAKIAECDLGSVLEDATRFDQVVSHGPDGGPGLVVSVCVDAPGVNPNTGYYPEDQQWIEIKPKGYWIGLQSSSPTKPHDLQRNGHLLQDYLIKLADGNDWAVMTINPFYRQTSMPTVGKLGADCEWEWRPHDKFAPLLKKYERVFAGEMDSTNYWADLAVDTLAVNYRVNKYLIMILGVIRDGDFRKIIELAMDYPEWNADDAAKKRGIERSEVSITNYGEVILPPL